VFAKEVPIELKAHMIDAEARTNLLLYFYTIAPANNIQVPKKK